MEIELKESNVELVIKCTKVELQHFAEGLKNSSLDDDEDCCDCDEEICPECSGNYQAMKKEIMKIANVQPIVRKKAIRRKA